MLDDKMTLHKRFWKTQDADMCDVLFTDIYKNLRLTIILRTYILLALKVYKQATVTRNRGKSFNI